MTQQVANELVPISEIVIQGKSFKVYGTSENPLFLARDVAEWIQHSKVSMMLKTVDEDEKLKRTLYVSGQRREVWLVTERGLKILLSNARNLKAKQILQRMEDSYLYKNTPKEINFHLLLEESVETIKSQFPERTPIEKDNFLNLLTQYRIGYYKVDFFFPGANLIVEYDESHHASQKEEDKKREEFIQRNMDVNFIRVAEGDEVQGIVEITTYLTKKFLLHGGDR